MIDYEAIGRSITHYELNRFKRIESPWYVPKSIVNITLPSFCKAVELNTGECLVGSAEQSFLSLYLNGNLPKGRFQSITPCFRDDDIDWLHQKYFIKNELIDTEDTSENGLAKILDICLRFFKSEFKNNVPKIVKKQNEGIYPSYDIEYDGIELGSYGIRSCNFLTWIYATGLAEPRLSSIKKKYGIS